MSEFELVDSQECQEGPCGKIEEMKDEVRRLRTENTDLKRQNLLQGEEIRLMKLRKYGQGSEKLTTEDICQGTLFDEAELYSTASDDTSATEEVRITPRRPPLRSSQRGHRALQTGKPSC